jgi:hypothetical protein
MSDDTKVTIDGNEIPESRVTIRERDPDPELMGTLEVPVWRIALLKRRAEALGITAADLAEQIFQHEDASISPLKLTRYSGQPGAR